MVDTDYKKHNVRGAVTYSSFTMLQAIAANERAKQRPKGQSFPKTDDKVAPEVQLLLDDIQAEKLIRHIVDVFLPECVKRNTAGEKRDIFDAKVAKKIAETLESGIADGWDTAPPHLPIKKVYVKTLEIAPWAVGTLKFAGTAGRDIEQLARVNGEDELKVPDPGLLVFPVLAPITNTVHDLYPGAWAYATLNLSAWTASASNYGISAYANTIVFLEDRDRLGGGAGLDEEDVFMDD